MSYRQSQHAFLLGELLVVVALVLIIATMTIPQAVFMHRVLLRLEIEKLYTLLLHMQQRAMATCQTQTITFQQAVGAYTTGAKQTVLVRGVQFGFLANAFGPPSSPVNRVTQAVTFPDQKILFYPDGTVSAGTVYMIDKAARSMYALTCPVAQLSYLRKYRYSDSQWVLVP